MFDFSLAKTVVARWALLDQLNHLQAIYDDSTYFTTNSSADRKDSHTITNSQFNPFAMELPDPVRILITLSIS